MKKKLTSVKDRQPAEVLLKEFNEADDCLTEHSKDVSMKACEFQFDNHKLHCRIHVYLENCVVCAFKWQSARARG